MSRRAINILVGAVSLLLGWLIYACFREETYVSALADGIWIVEKLRVWLHPLSCDFVKFYFPDLLWGLSLGCFLQAINIPERPSVLFWGMTVFMCGTLWELLQYTRIVAGTGDLLDVLMYLSAGFFSSIINLKERIK